MSATGLEVFDRTVQTTNVWIDEIMERLPRDKQLAWHVLGAVLRTIRDRVPINLAAHLGAQLPLLVRGTYYDQWRPSETPQNWRTADEFLAHIDAQLTTTKPVNTAEAARAVFRVLNHHVDPNQIENIRHGLPESIRALWPVNNADDAPPVTTRAANHERRPH
ncbi:uncharacterized protein (DUF2267 family) [Nitrobacteraceae bacterium AZCC 1564]